MNNFSKARLNLLNEYLNTNLPSRYFDQLKAHTLKKLENMIGLFNHGTELKLPILYGPGWSNLPVGVRRIASKEFKINVSLKEIKGIRYLTDENGEPLSKGGIVYKISGGRHGQR